MTKKFQHICDDLQPYRYDPLLACLLFVARLKQKDIVAQSITAGLPLKEGKLTGALMTRAGRGAGLTCRAVSRDLTDIPADVMPVLITLKNNQAALLLEKEATGTVVAYSPETGKVHRLKDTENLAKLYTGTSFYIKASPSLSLGGSAPLVQNEQSATLSNDANQTKGSSAWFWGTLKQFSRMYMQVILAAVFVNLIALASPLFVMNVYDRVVPNAAFETLWALGVGILLAYVFDFILKVLRSYFIDVAGRGADIMLSGRLFEAVLGARSGYMGTSPGAFANQLREYEGLREFFTSATLATLIDLPFIFLFILVIYLVAGPVALIPLIAVPLVLIFGYMIHKPLIGMMVQTAEASDKKHGHLVETIVGLETVKAIGSESTMQHRWEQGVGVLSQVALKGKFLSTLGLNFSGFIQQLVTVLIVIYGVYLIADGELSVGGLVAATILTGRTLAPLGQVVALFSRFAQAKTALSTLDQIMALPQERPTGKNYVHKADIVGNFVLKDVGFGYPNSQMSSLKDVNITIGAGEKVAVIGRMGSGKTTLLKMLMGLYQARDGAVLLDGVDIRQLDPAVYRDAMGYVPQNSQLFRGSVKENILMAAPHVKSDVLQRICDMTGVSHFTNRHPMGLDMPVGDSGNQLSGGQRQAIALARALCREGTVLLLDEPTSHLDTGQEMQVIQALKNVSRDKTMILVTHKLSLLELVDRIILLDDGKVIADGPRDQVIKQLQKGGK